MFKTNRRRFRKNDRSTAALECLENRLLLSAVGGETAIPESFAAEQAGEAYQSTTETRQTTQFELQIATPDMQNAESIGLNQASLNVTTAELQIQGSVTATPTNFTHQSGRDKLANTRNKCEQTNRQWQTNQQGLLNDKTRLMTPSEMRQTVGGAVPTHRVIGNTIYGGDRGGLHVRVFDDVALIVSF